MFGGLEKTCSKIHWRFVEDAFGDLERTYSAIFDKNLSAFWRNRSAILEKTVWRFWRNPFGASFGDLEKLICRNRGRRFGEIVRRFRRKLFGEFILEIIVEYCDARRLYVVIKT